MADSDFDKMYSSFSGKQPSPASTAQPQPSSKGASGSSDWDTMYANADKVGGTVTAPQASQEQPQHGMLWNMANKALNYSTDTQDKAGGQNPSMLDRISGYLPDPLSTAEGFAKDVISTGAGLGTAYNKLTGSTQPFNKQNLAPITDSRNYSQGIGGLGSQAIQYTAGEGLVSPLLKGAPLAARMAAKAGVGAAISGIGSGADPSSTAMGAATLGLGEATPEAIAALKGAKNWLTGVKDVKAAAVNIWRPTPRESGFTDNIENTLSNLKAESTTPIENHTDVSSAIDNSIKSRKELINQYKAKAAAQGATADLTPVVQATKDAIPATMWQEDPAGAKSIVDAANEAYGNKNKGIESLHDLLKSKNADASSFYDKASGQQITNLIRGNPEAIVKAQRDALSDIFYKTLDPETKGESVRPIGTQLRDLIDLKDVNTRRTNSIIGEAPTSNLAKLASPVTKGLKAIMGHGVGTAESLTSALEMGGKSNPLIKKTFQAIGDPIEALPKGPTGWTTKSPSGTVSANLQGIGRPPIQSGNPDLSQSGISSGEQVKTAPARQSGVKQSIPDTQAGDPNVTPDSKGSRERTAAARNVTARSIPKMGQGITSKVPGSMRPLPSKPTNFAPGTPEFEAMQQKLRQRS
jgi:hypothetical protein